MTSETTDLDLDKHWLAPQRTAKTRDVPCLVIAWSLSEPERVGEVVHFGDTKPRLLGRGEPLSNDPAPRLLFGRERPGEHTVGAHLVGRRLSRRQLLIRSDGNALHVESVGRCGLTINGLSATEGLVHAGDTLHLDKELVLLCARRPLPMPPLAAVRYPSGPFGAPDRFGIVGESPAAWALRDRLALVGRRAAHVLVLGASGSGKELAARALHGLSQRAAKPIVARSAATFPKELMDAELFGNARDYPNPGMRERTGLIGAATGSTLFLDEVGELPEALQAHLLRVLDTGGEYHRLGESAARKADLRFIAATNRDPEVLKHDLRARLTLRIELDGLNERREDIPLLIDHLLRTASMDDAEIGQRFFADWDGGGGGVPRIAPELIDRLLRHDYPLNVRGLHGLLWCAVTSSSAAHLALTDELQDRLGATGAAGPTRFDELTPEVIQASLDRNGGNQARVWRELGLKNRDVLYRLIKKHNLVTKRD